MTWAEAKRWWPWQPLLRASPDSRAGAEEDLYAYSDKGGRDGSPTDSGSISVLYQNPPHVATSTDFYGILGGGGIVIEVSYYRPGDKVPFAEGGWGQEPVTVRGKAARVMEMRKSSGQSNVDWRAIRWEEAMKEGAALQWEISSHPDLYTREQAIQFINELIEVRD